jgi:hypothetical protein
LLPGRLGEAVRRFFDDHLAGPLVYLNDHFATLDELSRAGITEVWNLPYSHKPEVAAGLNAASASMAGSPPHPAVRIVGGPPFILATINPSGWSPRRWTTWGCVC